MGDLWVLGDVHGQLSKATAVLERAGLLGRGGWTGGDARLWFIGDLVDRGPDGAGVIEMVMRLQDEAAAAGGQVGCILGNHEAMLLAALKLGSEPIGGVTFFELWHRNGGRRRDAKRLGPAQLQWLSALPAMALDETTLLVHCDTDAYLQLGSTPAAVNAEVAAVMQCDDPQQWAQLIGLLSERHVFEDRPAAAAQMLGTFGGERLVHGHTPITLLTGYPPDLVVGPLVYADGMCVNVDGGMYGGGRGFVWRVPPDPR